MHPLIREAQKDQLKNIPELKTGYTVKIHQKITEGEKTRVQSFEGLIIKVTHGQGIEKNITVRKMVEGIGVEKVFPMHSTTITKIEVKKKADVRRAKLYYMRDRSGKSARLTERHVTDKEREDEEAKREALIQEAVEAAEKKKKADEANTEVQDETPAEAPVAEAAQPEVKSEEQSA